MRLAGIRMSPTSTRIASFAIAFFGCGLIYAGGCITARSMGNLSCSMESAHTPKKGTFEFSLGYRDLYSDRHFRGTHEETERQELENDVRNDVQSYDMNLSYWLTDRWKISAGLPYITADRSSLYEHDFQNRYTMKADGIGDLRLMGFYESLFTKGKHPKGLTLGFGLKLPTGSDHVRDIAYRPTGPEERNIDQSIQPSDGGTGIYLEILTFTQIFSERNFLYFSGSYLVNPEETNGVETHRRSEAEAIMSVPDAYQMRLGYTRSLIPRHGLNMDVGLRNEGIPREDLIGGSNGFRRPGYAVYAEFGVSMDVGAHRVGINIPYAIQRNRVKSVADIQNGTHGDAAFADYLVLATYGYRW